MEQQVHTECRGSPYGLLPKLAPCPQVERAEALNVGHTGAFQALVGGINTTHFSWGGRRLL